MDICLDDIRHGIGFNDVLQAEILFLPGITALGVLVESRPIRELYHPEREQIERISILACFISSQVRIQCVAFEAVLERSTDKLQKRKLLHIVVGAVRPLTFTETNVALSMK
jgi:hypothetical protein